METESLKKSSDITANDGGNCNKKECKESHNDDKTETDCDETRNKQNLEKTDSFSENEINQKHLETSFDSDVEDEEDGQFRLNVSDKSDDDSDYDINFHEANKEKNDAECTDGHVVGANKENNDEECKDGDVKEDNKENNDEECKDGDVEEANKENNDVECKDDDVEGANKENDEKCKNNDIEVISDSLETETTDHSDAIENCKTPGSLNPSNDATKDLTGSNCETENMETGKDKKGDEDKTLDSNEITDSEEKIKDTEKGNSENEPEDHAQVDDGKEDAQKENNENGIETEDHTKDEGNKEHEQNLNEKSKDESEDGTKVEEKKKDNMEPECVKVTEVIGDKNEEEELNDKSTDQSEETDTADESKEHDVKKQNVENPIKENEYEDDDDCIEIKSKDDIIELTDDEPDFPDKPPEDPLSLKNASEGAEDADMDDDFDPSLLCPDINMEVDEAPVITSNDAPPPETDGTKSPSLYAPVFSTFVDEATGAEVEFNLTPQEEQLRRETYGQKHPVQFTKIHCTACNVHLGSALDGQSNRFVHPLLKVLICKNCYHFYTSGEFEKDEDGSELYCRWCGQGGQVICCSNCEMVFCKKCIRINFDKKKMAEIRDSDEWKCFRCNPSQLTQLRIHCAEFMEYITRELSRLQTLEDRISFMKTDHALCCKNLKRKPLDELGGVKKKRKKWSLDPDYDPFKDVQPQDAMKKKPLTESSFVPITADTTIQKFTKTTPVPIAPKLVPIESKIPKLTAIGNSNIIQVGSTTFKKTLIPNQKIILTPIPIQKGATSLISNAIKEASKSTLPSPPSTIRVIKRQTLLKKNTWFDKGVTGTARVNSNLSYTMTQLYKTLARAGTVEEKAAVHNKFQEALSSSINNLIQIRKNLRADFITDLKSQSTANQPKPSTSKAPPDDDVIIISSSSQPPPLTPVKTTPSILQSVSLLKRPTNPIVKQLSAKTSPAKTPPPKTSPAITPPPKTPPPKMPPAKAHSVKTPAAKTAPAQPLLRVKPLQALQNVSSECILIPDDDNNDNNNKKDEKLLNGGSSITIRKLTGKKNSELSVSKKVEDKIEEVVKLSDSAKKQIDWNSIKKVRVVVRKSEDVEKLVQQQMKKKVTNNRD